MKNIYLLAIICFLAIPCFGTKKNLNGYSFSKINGNDGLSHNNIKSILQDSWGFMWFGTLNGLNRYDGYSIKVFNCVDEKKNKTDNNISALFEDKDKNIWVGTDNGVYVFSPTSETFAFFDSETENGLKIQDWVSDIQADKNGNIWIVIPNQGVFRYALAQKKLYHYYVVENMKPSVSNPQCICIENNGNVWIGTNREGIFLYNHDGDRFTQYLGDKNGKSLKGEHIYTLCDYGEELVVGIHEGKLKKIHKRNNTLKDIKHQDIDYKIIRDVKLYNNQLYVATQNGIYIIDETQDTPIHLSHNSNLPHSLSDNTIEKIYKDREGNIWFGTHFGGASYLPNRGYNFEKYIPTESHQSISSKIVREIHEDNLGRIWVGTEDNGLNLFYPETRTFKRIGLSENHLNTLGLMISDDKVWVGAFKDGLDIIDLHNFSKQHYSASNLGLNDPSIYAICEDSHNNIWIGSAWAVYVSKKNEMKFKRFDRFGLNFIFDIKEDKSGNIWVATMGNGVYKYNQATDSVSHYRNETNNKTTISSNSVTSITISSLDDIWFSTDRGGICRYNKKTDDFTTFSIEEGLPDNITYKILEDKDYNLWFGTNKGLVQLNPKTKAIKIFTQNDGLPDNQFNYKSALVSSTGLLYFGTLNGMIILDPYQVKINEYIPPVFITKITIFNKEVSVGQNSPLQQSIIHTSQVSFSYDQANIGFSFAALSYVAPRANRYAYKLEGIDSEWNYTNSTHTSSYAKLPPGKYIFKVKGSNNDGVWNEDEASIQITILPPWWLSNIALVIYILLIVAVIYFIIYQYNKKAHRKRIEQQRIFEIQKEKELYGLKVDFFTNIAHEIRTPITLINGPLEAILQMEISDSQIKKNLHIMEQSTAQLLSLVNQLLDFRKVDSNKFILNISPNNISQIIKELVSIFSTTISQKGKSIELEIPEEDIITAIDKEAFIKIMNNLMSNALKYSKDKIQILVENFNSEITITVSNDGKRIPNEYHEKIFEAFYQLEQDSSSEASSGIGLTLSKSLALLHHGDLYLDINSSLNTFILKLPVVLTNKNTERIDEDEMLLEDNDTIIDNETRNVILVVEDNVELLSFLSDRLSETFIVKTANCGEKAIEVLDNNRVDLVVSDIMMDNMDGIQLCEKIKTNIDYSHIPIILLTAKNDLASKIKGLEAGAEAYIEKPFSFHFLITQISTLLSNRRRAQEAYLNKPLLGIQQIGMSKTEEQFMDKLIKIIHENISESDFNVERLAELTYVSRASLLRKIKALSGLTPIEFIRVVKLKKAAELILTGDYQINEVSYLIGINSPSYFIKLFQKQFGATPKEFIKQQSSAPYNKNESV